MKKIPMTSKQNLQDHVKEMFTNSIYTERIQARLHSEEWSECLYTSNPDKNSYLGEIFSGEERKRIRKKHNNIPNDKQEEYLPHLERLVEESEDIHRQMLEENQGQWPPKEQVGIMLGMKKNIFDIKSASIISQALEMHSSILREALFPEQLTQLYKLQETFAQAAFLKIEATNEDANNAHILLVEQKILFPKEHRKTIFLAHCFSSVNKSLREITKTFYEFHAGRIDFKEKHFEFYN